MRKGKLFFGGVAIVLLPFFYSNKRISFSGNAQGTSYNIIYYAKDTLVQHSAIDSLLAVIDSSLSLYHSYSLVSQFNRSDKGVQADRHLKNVITKAQKVHQLSQGAFDVTVWPLTQVWGFGIDKNKPLPDSAAVSTLLSCVSSELLYWKNDSLLKQKPCVQLDVNGIAQGYSVDVLADFLENKGIQNYLVSIGGEIRVKGKKQAEAIEDKIKNSSEFVIGIEKPDELNNISWYITALKKGAITTSGNYRQYAESDGKKMAHILNPKTGFSQANEMISVTVYAADAITADAWDNVFMLWGVEKSMQFLKKRKDMSAFFVYRDERGEVRTVASKRFPSLSKR